ncbi:MAG: outer membrane protein transport protein [Betaproteobacteria bacterium]|nr:OmpP1/FadL family transporter [Betaproteobacteria bacterium]MDE2002449.1 outer membrane protein transport protein [Betaproteobacteria bacterium]MDE2208452.1 outer membrane protein transport protein [Betaproteobacteria bacterium]MDE2360884.1 outer membrane protein transport protein [Betaproteobacteria bacterium]
MRDPSIGIKRTRVAAAIGAAMLAFAAGQAQGAAFALQENSGSGLGNAFAGGAAAAEDASTIWSNPAGMAKLASPQAAVAVHLITPSIKFGNSASAPAALQPLGGPDGNAGSLNVVPNLYLSMPVNAQWSIGLGINAPFGLTTEWGGDWLGRYQAVKSKVETINVNPAVSWRVNDTFAVGAGIDWQHIKAQFTSRVNYSGALGQAALGAAAGGLIPPSLVPTIAALTPGLDATSAVNGTDSAWGWNAGFIWDATPQTRVGAQYRSSIKYNVSGDVGFGYPALPALPPALAPVVGLLAGGVNGVLANGGVTAAVKLPDIANASIFHRLNDQWDVMGDVQFTHWSVFKNLTFVRTTGAVLASTPENFRDTWRISAGATYHWNDAWSFRSGLAWDETPVNSTDITPRLPDGNRTWVSLGTQYKLNRNLALDAGFTYVFVNKADTNQNAGSTSAYGLINGHYDSNVTILSGQLTYSF